MGFANPWLLFGLAALAVPVLAHLVLREDRRGRAFPSLMLVRRLPIERKRRRRLRDRALLALRCLALAAVVLAFAAPYRDPAPASPAATANGTDTVWLLDRSYSMSPGSRWNRAVAEIQERIQALGPGERAALVAFDDEPHVVSGLTGSRAALRAALARIEPGRRGTGLAAAFAAADEILAEAGAARRSVVIVSDLQRSALEGVGALPLDARLDLEIVPVGGPVGANATVVDARLAARRDAAVEDTLAVRVSNTGDAALTGARAELVIDGRVVEGRPLELDPGAERTLSFPIVLPGDRATPVTLRVGPDALAADDAYHAVLAPRRPLAAALVEPDRPRHHHGVFLEEALRLARAPAVTLRRVPGRAVDDELLEELDVLILDDVTLPSASAERAVAEFVSRGGGLLLAAGPSLDAAPVTGPLGPAVARGGDGARMVAATANHPLWGAPGLEGGAALAAVRIDTARRLEPGPDDRVIARLDDGAPVLVERAAGAGRVLTLATTADPRWGSLALEPGFVPLVHAAVAHVAGGNRWRAAYAADEVVDLLRHAEGLPGATGWRAYLGNGGAVVVEKPSGATEDSGQRQGSMLTTGIPGIYEVHRADGRGPVLPFAVNVARRESRFAAAAPAELERRLVRRSRPAAPPPHRAGRASDSPYEAAWWLLMLAALALIIETGLASGMSRRRAAPAAGARP